MNQKGKLINNGYSPVGIDLGVCMLSHFSCVRLFATLWTVAHQAPLSMGFSRQEYWSGLPCPPPGDLLNPGIKAVSLMSPALQADSLPLAPPELKWQSKVPVWLCMFICSLGVPWGRLTLGSPLTCCRQLLQPIMLHRPRVGRAWFYKSRTYKD